MLFNSFEYIIFLPTVFIIYWFVLRNNFRYQNFFLMCVSFLFYGWWDYRFLGLLLLASLNDFYLGQAIDNATSIPKKKLFLGISIFFNLGTLCFFKYFNFFIDSFIQMGSLLGFHFDPWTLKVILPVGISFYTFQSLSYTFDIYKGKMKANKDLISFLAFVSFFPQLVAGPIERAFNILPRFEKPRIFNYGQARDGLQLIAWGLFKKVVIADRLAEYVNVIFGNIHGYSGIVLIIGAMMFSFQIYCDFSGYSHIAQGSAKLIGFELMDNFRTPYFSKSIQEFWSRWHISLSTWFRDYLYIPMGGNRVSTPKWIRNIMTTFTVSGFWHGANFTFIVWGAIHGLVNSLEVLLKKYGIVVKLPTILNQLKVYLIVCFAWIFFRANTMSDALLYIKRIPIGIAQQFSSLENLEFAFRSFASSGDDLKIISIAFLVFFMIDFYLGNNDTNSRFNQLNRYFRWALFTFLTFGVLVYGAFNKTAQFIYFQF